MRLLCVDDRGDFRLVEYMGTDDIPPYAILSHTWGASRDEVSFTDLMDGTGEHKPGYCKLVFCAQQATNDRLQFFWVDTCCIDKSSSAELSEGINSMYAWYRKSTICYAYLADVDCDIGSWHSQLKSSRWFTRGWTLQELLAPEEIVFYDKNWQCIGTKKQLGSVLSDITSIEVQYLYREKWETMTPQDKIQGASLARRFSWLAMRKTTRSEDMAYCMLGIFDINMPLLYGEGGSKAFLRLQLEIIKVSNDHTIFCWSWPESMPALEWLPCFAPCPEAFRNSRNYVPIENFHEDGAPEYSATNAGLQIDLPLISNGGGFSFAVLNARNLDMVPDHGSLLHACLVLWPRTQNSRQVDHNSRRANGPPFPVHLNPRWSSQPQRVYISRQGGPPVDPDSLLCVDIQSSIAILPVCIRRCFRWVKSFPYSPGPSSMRRLGTTNIWFENLYIRPFSDHPGFEVSIVVQYVPGEQESKWCWTFPVIDSIDEPDVVVKMSQLKERNLMVSEIDRLHLSRHELRDSGLITWAPGPLKISCSHDETAVRNLEVGTWRLDVPAYIVCAEIEQASFPDNVNR